VRRCEYAAQLYQLSPREFDVLVLLAKGRSMSYVQETLVVSEGTAKTHIRHIYRKMNVHSRHELVELIESIDLE
jgi:DNA-binding CsgD family transcriptional regulator